MRKLALALAVVAGCAGQPSDQLEPIDLTIRQKPQVTIASPAPGSFVPVAPDGMIDVTGSARGTSLLVNGRATPVDSHGNFHTRIPASEGVNVIDAHLSGLLGGEAQRAFLYGNFARPDTILAHGVMVRATGTAWDDKKPDLNDFSSIARAMLAEVDLMTLVKQLPPYTWTLGDVSVDVAVTKVAFDQQHAALSLSPRAGGAHVDGGIRNVQVTLSLTLHYGGDWTTTGTVSVDTVGFNANIDAAYQKGQIVASTETPNIALGTLNVATDLDFPGVDDFLTFLANQFKDLIARTVAQQIQASAANHFALALNQIGLPSQFSLAPYGLNATLALTDSFDGASFDALGVNVSAQTNFSWPQVLAGAGSLIVGSAPATAFHDAPMSVSVAVDALDQAAFAVWGQNGLSQQVYPAKSFAGIKLDPLIASPALPPVIAAADPTHVQVSVGDIVVATTLHTWIADFPFQVTLSGVTGVALDIDPSNGALRMTPTGTPRVWVDVNTLFGVVPDVVLAPISAFLQQVAPSIVQKMVKPIEVPLPKLSLARLIPGSTASVGLKSPLEVSVDTAAKRVIVSGDLAAYP
jgi:hypothetical protein